jgi:hypothetical protein
MEIVAVGRPHLQVSQWVEREQLLRHLGLCQIGAPKKPLEILAELFTQVL